MSGQLPISVLVYGWYNNSNIGDDLFVHAFCKLFPNLNLKFTNFITAEMLQNVSAVIFGGGSFLDQPPAIERNVNLDNKTILYIGVGTETNICDAHLKLMSVAKLIATRTSNVEKLVYINPNVIVIPDLVYSLYEQELRSSKPESEEKHVLILPNISVIPNNNDKYWKHAAWSYFKSEFSQFIDYLIDCNCSVGFFPMCKNHKLNDVWAASEIMNSMLHKEEKLIINKTTTSIKLLSLIFKKYDLIITQRFHGIVLAEMFGKQYISIHHHDKLNSALLNYGSFMSYYGVSKAKLLELSNNKNEILPIEGDIFKELKYRVGLILGE